MRWDGRMDWMDQVDGWIGSIFWWKAGSDGISGGMQDQFKAGSDGIFGGRLVGSDGG